MDWAVHRVASLGQIIRRTKEPGVDGLTSRKAANWEPVWRGALRINRAAAALTPLGSQRPARQHFRDGVGRSMNTAWRRLPADITLAGGSSAQTVLNRYRAIMRANEKRLS